MKTRHFAAMALPLLLVACSQEELVNSNENTSLSNRKVVENVTIRFNEPNSRLAFEGGYKWENGDKFGACLMDEFKGEDDDNWFNQFNLINYIQSNYPFTRQEGGNWTNTEAVMQEGNYFFYYPYNSNLGGKRTPIRIVVPTNQVLEDGAAASSVLDNQLFAAYAPIVADPTKGDHEVITNLTMEPLLAFPAFNITNNTGNPFTVYRIAITGEDADEAIKFPTVLEVKPAQDPDKKFQNEEFVNDDWTAAQKRAEIMKIVAKNEADVTSKVSLVFGENGKTLSNGDKFTSYILLPAVSMLENGTADGVLSNLKLELYTDKGLVTVALNSDDPNDGDGDDIKVQNSLTTYEYNDGHITYITLDEKAFATPNSMEVSSTRDLEDLVTWNKNTQGTIKANITNDVTLSKAVYDVLAANSKLNLQLEGTAKVTIPAEAPANALNRVKFVNDNNNKLNVINKANLTLSADFAEAAPASLTNEEGASITVTGNAFTANNLVNKGTITFDSANDKVINVAIAKLGDFTNDVTGKVVFASDAKYSYGITNKGEVTINEKITLTGKVDNKAESVATGGYVDGKVYVNGNWVLEGESGENHGKIVVAKTGTIEVPNAYTNVGTFDYMIGSTKHTYNATIENSGVISGITNNSYIIMKDADARLESVATSNGFVDNTVLSPYVQKVSGETIYAFVSGENKASEVADIVRQSNAKLLKISGTVTIDPAENETAVEIKGQQTVFEVEAIGNLNIKPAKAGVEVKFVTSEYVTNKNAGYANFTVKAGTTIVESGATLSIGQFSGTILVQSGAIVWSNSAKPGENIFGNWNTRK